jgi:hypothetical protein
MNDSPLASIIESAIRDGVEILNLHGLGLEELPPLFAELRSLRRLHLSGNRLRTVPAEVFRLVNLEVLDLEDNQLSTLPAGLAALKKLRVLYLSRNQLTSIDANALPASLDELYLDDNQLKEIPARLSRMKHLSVRGNPIEDVVTNFAPDFPDDFIEESVVTRIPAFVPELAPERPPSVEPELAPPAPAPQPSGARPPYPAQSSLPVPDLEAVPAATRDSNETVAPGAEPVDSAVFCPPQVARNSIFLLQVFLYPPRAATEVDRQAKQADETAERRGTYSLPLDLPLGTRVDLRLEIPALLVAEPDAVLMWRGSITAAQFEVEVPRDVTAPQVIGRVRIAVAGVPAGTLRFQVGVVAAGTTPGAPDAREVRARRYHRAFVSYSSQDRAEVLRRVQAFKIAGLTVFQDVLELDPGERWEQRLYQEIDSCDVFLLFWSHTAAASEWVLKEIDYAIARKQGDDEHPPDIQPVPIEGPPIVPPPATLKDLHFNDNLLAQIQAADGIP